MRYPSIKTLSQLCDGDMGKAMDLRAILMDETQGEYGRLQDCNDALGTDYGCFGVEYCDDGKYRDYGDCDPRGFNYINTGDLYNLSLVLTNTGRFRVCCPADICEKWS